MDAARPKCTSGTRKRLKRTARPQGFTLLEVLLTLSILTILVGLAWPQLRTPLKTYQLRRAAEEIRVAWSKARVQAMTSGIVYAFRHELEGRQYTIEAWSEIDPQEEFSAALAVGTAQVAGAYEYQEGEVAEELPEPIQFVGTQKTTTSRDLSFEPDELTTAQLMNWSTPVFFYPDGTTSTASVTLVGENETYISLQIRGLTGVSKLSEHNSLPGQVR